jgi:hypothetical protein
MSEKEFMTIIPGAFGLRRKETFPQRVKAKLHGKAPT